MEGQVSGTDSAALQPQLKGPAFRGGATVAPSSSRLSLVAAHDPDSGALVRRLLAAATQVLPQARVAEDFVFTLSGTRAPDGGWLLHPLGISQRYGAITALGLLRLAERDQRATLAGAAGLDLVGHLAKNLDDETNRGNVALLCWAAAEAGHSELPHALRRLAALDQGQEPIDVVAAAWIVTALVAARSRADVEQHLAAARGRLLAAQNAVYSHVIGATSGYRSHVGCFADQVYPLQALARLHHSADDPKALAAADKIAAMICRAQGPAGQWWWHYDSRTGEVVEGYPVYSVHQYAMAPMALFDLADAGGQVHLEAICQGLRWLAGPVETSETLILDDPPVTWRKVARSDPRKMVRGLRAAATRMRPGTRLPLLDWMFPPGVVDHECRPYEFGWLLLAWLTSPGGRRP